MENEQEFGPQLPTRNDVVEMFKDESKTDAERMFTLTRLIDAKRAESEVNATRITPIAFDLKLANLYLEIGYINEAKVSLHCAYVQMENLLPEEGETIDNDLLDVYFLYWEIRDAINATEASN